MENKQPVEMPFVRLPRRFSYAQKGAAFLVHAQPNARARLLAAVMVSAAGFYSGLSRAEWLWIIAAVVLVWSAEAFDTALERLADALHPQQHPGIDRAKDVAAAELLVAAGGAAVIGTRVFVPHLAGLDH